MPVSLLMPHPIAKAANETIPIFRNLEQAGEPLLFQSFEWSVRPNVLFLHPVADGSKLLLAFVE